MKDRSEQDVEDADDSTATVPWTLSQAREVGVGRKIFLQANQGEHPELREYMGAVVGLERLLERMMSARSR